MSAARAVSKSRRMMDAACWTRSRRLVAERIDEVRTTRSSGRRPMRSTKRTRSKWRNGSVSALSIASLNLSARKGSRAMRWVSFTRRRKVRRVEVSQTAAVLTASTRDWVAEMSLRRKCRYVSIPCWSES